MEFSEVRCFLIHLTSQKKKMNELNELKTVNKQLMKFVDSQFCCFTDIDTKFPFSSSTEFGISLFKKGPKDENNMDFITNLYTEHSVDAYLSKIIYIPAFVFQNIYRICIEFDDKHNISRLEYINFPVTSMLFESCKSNNVPVINHLLLKGFDVNVFNDKHESPLHIASSYGYLDIVKLLVENKANIDSVDEKGNTPLMCACENKHEETALFLIHSKANLNIFNNEKNSPLHSAVRNNFIRIIEEGIKRGCDLNIIDKNDNTPLIEASRIGNTEIIKLLANNRANVNSQNILGQTALYFAVKGQYTDLVIFLLGKGADYRIPTLSKELPIDVARKLGNKEIEYIISRSVFIYLKSNFTLWIKSYILEGGDINIVNSNGSTLLHECIILGFDELAIILIQSGADLMKKNNFGRTPVLLAIEKKCTVVLKEMIKRGFKYNQKELYELTKIAELQNCAIILKYLERNDNLVHSSDDYKHKQTLSDTFSAIRNKDVILLKTLIETGASIDERDNVGNTPLIFASAIKNNNIIKYLVEKGANVNEKNNFGDTPLMIASATENEKTVKYLIENGANINGKANDGATALHFASLYGHENIVKYLIDNGSNINEKDNNGNTSLFFCFIQWT